MLTPVNFSKGGSMHQKQPPANVAFCRPFSDLPDSAEAMETLDRDKTTHVTIKMHIRFKLFIADSRSMTQCMENTAPNSNIPFWIN